MKIPLYQSLINYGNPSWLAAWKCLGAYLGYGCYLEPDRWGWPKRIDE